MTKLEQIEKSVSTLSDEKLKAFANWFAELQWQRWDRQLEADVKAANWIGSRKMRSLIFKPAERGHVEPPRQSEIPGGL